VVLAADGRAEPGEIRDWARTRLAAFKVPRDIRIVGALPRNATGKILKADLRSTAKDGGG
jgi:acyl-CoA synthetase (AMP-forming)/AMP-acid ligase II